MRPNIAYWLQRTPGLVEVVVQEGRNANQARRHLADPKTERLIINFPLAHTPLPTEWIERAVLDHTKASDTFEIELADLCHVCGGKGYLEHAAPGACGREPCPERCGEAEAEREELSRRLWSEPTRGNGPTGGALIP